MMPSHFMRYIKSWRKNQDRRDAKISSGTNRLNDALEYIPESEVLENFEIEPLSLDTLPALEDIDLSLTQTLTQTTTTLPPTQDPTAGNAPALQLLCTACQTQPALPKKKRRKHCQVVVNGETCPYPTTCPGRAVQKNCFLYTGGDPEKKVKRKMKKVVKIKTCKVCGTRGYQGARKRYLCKNVTVVAI